MPVSVPTSDEFEALSTDLYDRVSDLQSQIADLDARVAALEGGTEPTPPDPPDPPDPPVDLKGLTATIVLDGTDYVFSQDGGQDLGDYVDPAGRFTQRCVRATCATLPDFTVMFRPDADGMRDEVVFEYGRIFGNPAGNTLGAYTATIARDGGVLATVAVPKHFYYARWRWQSAVRPATVKVADLIAAHKIPPLDKSLVAGGRAAVHGDDGPMAYNGICSYMPTTGERDDIGVVTECAADYIMYEDEQGLGTLRAWLEGGNSLSWCYRDEQTGAPADIVTYPYLSTMNYGNPLLPPCYTYQEENQPDTSHAPDCGYVIFLLTGDPYALELLQFEAVFGHTATDFHSWGMGGALRSYAWHLRDILNCAVATPAAVPSWLLPQSMWQGYLDDDLAWSLANCGPDSTTDWMQNFQYQTTSLNSYGEISGFMEDYCTAVYCHAADLFPETDWVRMRDWAIRSNIARTNGTSGWNRSMCVSYVYQMKPGNTTSPTFASWGEMFDYANNPSSYTWTSSGGGGWENIDPSGQTLAAGIGMNYVWETLFCLDWTAARGNAEAAACATWLRSQALPVRTLRWAL